MQYAICARYQWRFPRLIHSHCVSDAAQNMKDEEAELRELQVGVSKLVNCEGVWSFPMSECACSSMLLCGCAGPLILMLLQPL